MSAWANKVVVGLVAVLAVLLGACSDDGAKRDDEGRVVSAGAMSVFDLQPGDCVAFDENLEAEVENLPLVPCEEPHTGEVYALVELEQFDTYPGERELSIAAERECLTHFADYVGVDLADSVLFPTTAIPGIRGWQDDKDRTAVCFVVTAGEPTASSAKGSRR